MAGEPSSAEDRAKEPFANHESKPPWSNWTSGRPHPLPPPGLGGLLGLDLLGLEGARATCRGPNRLPPHQLAAAALWAGLRTRRNLSGSASINVPHRGYRYRISPFRAGEGSNRSSRAASTRSNLPSTDREPKVSMRFSRASAGAARPARARWEACRSQGR
jgi:hypothetical protein